MTQLHNTAFNFDQDLVAGTYDLVFFDKYTYRSNGEVDDRRVSVDITGSSEIFDEDFRAPTAGVEGVVIANYEVTIGTHSFPTSSSSSSHSIGTH